MSDVLDKIIAEVTAKLREAFEAGAQSERDRMLNLLALEALPRSVAVDSIRSLPLASRPVQRATPGTIRLLVLEAVRRRPGMTKGEIAREVLSANPAIAPRSITNELQRNSGNGGHRLYHTKTHRWYLRERDDVPELEARSRQPAKRAALNGG